MFVARIKGFVQPKKIRKTEKITGDQSENYKN